MQADEASGDAGVLGEGSRDGLADQRLGVRAGGVVEPHPELRAGRRRQQDAHCEGQQGRSGARWLVLPSHAHSRPCGG